ncbi:Acyl transferase domain-containing protein [[Clostridium] polysaccharolyticum]|uniref:Acyl transferase domain-containing protein n=2 Tax=[Clostridium] polysaccharolyticum TaxID=29364 RepID=A0A1I0EUL9_9FIRM|nr:Acyl transferase domain-containing protein [[Clostridium] polysaccharolyticum]
MGLSRGKVDVMYKNLIEVITSKVEENNRGIYFIRGEDAEEFLSYKELYELAWRQKQCMIEKGLKAKTEVILQYEDNREFLIAFWACILGRMIPVPLPAQKGKESVGQVLKIYRQLRNPYIATINSRRKEIVNDLDEKDVKKIHIYENAGNCELSNCVETPVGCNPDDVAFLQFSSGSTGEPKGVQISHYNLLENFKGMVEDSEVVETDSILSWMPLYHNIGLIISHMLGIYCNIDSYLMNTDLFIYRPYLWMEKVSEHKVTLTCSPNFGYRYYLRGIMNRDCSGLDLSNLRIILNGAEPITLKACNTFLEMMKQYHLRENVFQTGYGLSEATVSVTSTKVGRLLENVWICGENQRIGTPVQFLSSEDENSFVVELVKVGRTHRNNEIRIVDEEGNVLEEDYFGEIQVAGTIISSGYYDGLNQNEKMKIQDGWLSTGDIGFIHEGELIISGRKKDIIFVNGKNYYCHDLENIIKEEYPNCECAICGIFQKEAERDQIILFLVKGDQTFIELRKFGDSLKKRIAKRTGIILDKVVLISEIPKTNSGKIQRFQLKEWIEKKNYYDLYQQYSRAQVIDIIQEQLKNILGFTIDDLDESIVEAGVNSIKAAQFHKLMSQVIEMELPVSLVFDYPTVNAIADFILGEDGKEYERQETKELFQSDDIAVIGMACQFPNGADSLEKYWKKLLEGYDGITEIPQERTLLKNFCEKNQLNIKGGFLADIDKMDAGFFGITPIEAKYLDPQQRLLLTNSYLALQDAFLDRKKLRGSKTGVFIGISNSDYKEILPKDEAVSYMLSGNMNNMAAGRISYTFDFQGPSMVIDTACSSSLVAIHQAVLSLQSGESDMALAGGVNCILSPYGYLGLMKMEALSPTGHCHTFGEEADGYVRSEGCGMVVLKRYQEARRDGDRVYALIKGSAINSDGWSSGLTAPNGMAQVRVMRQALKNAGISPEDVSFVETHGTGTKLGDPQEINALHRVYGERKEELYLGAGKTNIGHAESAAGIAAFIKTVLAAYYGILPGNYGIAAKNSYIPWKRMKFQVLDKAMPWRAQNRIAGISSFGLSGTNAHVIVAQAEPMKAVEFPKKYPQILTLSARKLDQLHKEIEHFADFLEKTDAPMEQIIYTANRHKASEKYRLGLAAAEKEEYIEQLQKASKKKSTGQIIAKNNKIVLLCGEIQKLDTEGFFRLYEENEVFQKAITECERILQSEFSLKEMEWVQKLGKGTDREQEKWKLYFSMAVQYGLIAVLKNFGVEFSGIAGHGNGEWIGCVVAGKITLRQAFVFATYILEAKQKYGRRKKAALLFLSEEEWENIKQTEQNIHLLTVNSRESIVVVYEEVSEFLSCMEQNQISYIELEEYVLWIDEKEKAKEEVQKRMEGEQTECGIIPYYSTQEYGKGGQTKQFHFWELLEQTAHIQKTMEATEALDCSIYLECNARPYLSALAEQNLQEEKYILPVIRKAGREELQLRTMIGKLYGQGVNIHFSLGKGQGDWLVSLPGTELKQSKFWF